MGESGLLQQISNTKCTASESQCIRLTAHKSNGSKATFLMSQFICRDANLTFATKLSYAFFFIFRLPVDGCIGRRFFQSAAHVNLLNEMKKRLTEVADFHHAASKALRVESPEDSDRSPKKASCSPDYLTSPELHKELVR